MKSSSSTRPTQATTVSQQELSTPALLGLAAWFGLTAGLIEGAGLLAVYGYGLWNRYIRPGVSVDIIYISAIFDLVLFCGVGLVMLLARRLIRVPVEVIVSGFALFAFGDWVSLTGRISVLGAVSLTLGLTAVFYRWFVRNPKSALAFFQRTLPALAVVTLLLVIGIPLGVKLQQARAIADLPSPPKNVPNVVFLVIDTLRADHLSSFGYHRTTSPNIDELARQSTVFENAISPAPWTLPAHASLLTGRLPHEHLAVGDEPLSTHFQSLAESMRSMGYTTAAFSGNIFYFNRRTGLGSGFIYFDDYNYSLADAISRTFWGRVFVHFSDKLGLKEFPVRQRAEQITRSVFSWIDRHPDKPFFVFLNFNDLHDPYLPPQPWRGRFSNVKEPGGIIRQGHAYPDLAPQQLQGEMDSYDGALAYTDNQVGVLLAGLQKRGLTQNTLVILVADHGECFGDHNLLEHRNALYRELVQVPLIVRWPDKLPAGLRLQNTVSTASLAATIFELIGGNQSVSQNPFPGPSLVELWKNPAQARDLPYPVSEMAQYKFLPETYPAYSGSLQSITSPGWQFIEGHNRPAELYNWAQDNGEIKNLAASPSAQGVLTDLAEQLHRRTTNQPQAATLFPNPSKGANQ
ncbi:MAG TPA: sulfatase [Terriglobales bacterium]|nr:sulfatase [Terriglobales bacterium]